MSINCPPGSPCDQYNKVIAQLNNAQNMPLPGIGGTINSFRDSLITEGCFNPDPYANFPCSAITQCISGTTSGNCWNDLFVSNLHGCSPITIHDNLIFEGSTVYPDVTYTQVFGAHHTIQGTTSDPHASSANTMLGGTHNIIAPDTTIRWSGIIGGSNNLFDGRGTSTFIIGSENSHITNFRNIILGGENHLFTPTPANSVIIGGSAITADTSNLVYVPSLNIDTDTASLSSTATDVLVRESDGLIQSRKIPLTPVNIVTNSSWVFRPVSASKYIGNAPVGFAGSDDGWDMVAGPAILRDNWNVGAPLPISIEAGSVRDAIRVCGMMFVDVGLGLGGFGKVTVFNFLCSNSASVPLRNLGDSGNLSFAGGGQHKCFDFTVDGPVNGLTKCADFIVIGFEVSTSNAINDLKFSYKATVVRITET